MKENMTEKDRMMLEGVTENIEIEGNTVTINAFGEALAFNGATLPDSHHDSIGDSIAFNVKDRILNGLKIFAYGTALPVGLGLIFSPVNMGLFAVTGATLATVGTGVYGAYKGVRNFKLQSEFPKERVEEIQESVDTYLTKEKEVEAENTDFAKRNTRAFRKQMAAEAAASDAERAIILEVDNPKTTHLPEPDAVPDNQYGSMKM